MIKIIDLIYLVALFTGLLLIYGCGKKANNLNPYTPNTESVAIPGHAEAFTCVPNRTKRETWRICKNSNTICELYDNHYHCYRRY